MGRGRYNPRAEGHVEPYPVKVAGRKIRLWVLNEDKVGEEHTAFAQSVMRWLVENDYRYVRIFGIGPYEQNKYHAGWVHRNQPCPECGQRFDVDGRCTVGCINH